MNRFNRQQRRDVENFRSVTGVSERVAADALKSVSWNLQRALDAYYSSNAARTPVRSSSTKTDRRNIDKLWNKYKGPTLTSYPRHPAVDPSGDMISAHGVGQFCEDLNVDPSDVSLLVFSYHCNAEHMGMFTKDEFVSALVKLGCDSVEKLRDRLPDLASELDSDVTFRNVYSFAFLFARETGIKFVEKTMAIALWRLMFTGQRQWELLGDWCSFLEGKDIIAIQKDTWDQLLDFAWTVRSDFSNFDPNGAWPYLIDEFVEQTCKARGLPLPG